MKARRHQNSISATGGGVGVPGLTEADQKVLDIVGSASVQGFTNSEAGIPSTSADPHPHSMLPTVDPNLQPAPEDQVEVDRDHATSSGGQRRSFRRRQRVARTRQPVHNDLVQALNENSRLFRESIVQAAEIIAQAIRSAGLPVFVAQQESENNSMQ